MIVKNVFIFFEKIATIFNDHLSYLDPTIHWC